MPFVAIINTPGYLPDSEPVEFDTAREAWSYLADEREQSESDMVYDDRGVDGCNGEFACALSDTLHVLFDLASEANWRDGKIDSSLGDNGLGTVTGTTPGYDGDHDLGLAYTVEWVAYGACGVAGCTDCLPLFDDANNVIGAQS